MKYEKTVEALRRRGFEAVEVATKEEAASVVMKEAEAAASVGWGGSESVKALGVREALAAAGKEIRDLLFRGFSVSESGALGGTRSI